MAEIVGEPDVKYTPKDFASLRPELVQLIKNRFPGIITDFSSQNVITVIIELLAYLGDMLAFYQDAQAREAFFSTAKLRASLLKHAALIGYVPQGRVAATALMRVELLADSAFDILVPANSVFTTADQTQLIFRSLADATLPAGVAGDFIDIYVENSTPFQEVTQAEGDAFFAYVTNRSPVLLSGIDENGDNEEDVLQVLVDGIPWDRVTSFIESTPTDSHYTVSLDNQNRAVVTFGDGISGIAPTGEVRVIGRTGGGEVGNNARITQGPSLRNTNNEPVSLSFTNSVLSAGGADEQSISSIRVQAPLSLQASNRTVSPQDFITNSESVSGVDRALPLTSNEDPGIEENKTEVIIITESPTNAQLVGGNSAALAITAGVDDDIGISIDGEAVQVFSLGTQSSGEDIAAALQAAIRGATPEFPLDHAESYSNFLVEFDSANERYTLTAGQAGLDSDIVISAGPNDGTVALKLTAGEGAVTQAGSEPSAATSSAVLQVLIVDKPVCITHVVEVFGPDTLIFNLDMRVRFSTAVSTAAARATVRDLIRTAYEEFFAPRLSSGVANPEIDFGRTVRFSDLICVANDVLGVESIDEDTFMINGGTDDVPLTIRQFPVLGGLTIRDEAGDVI